MHGKALAQFSLEEKVGQLFVTGFHADAVDDQARKLIARHHVGNIVLFRRNFSTRERVQRMNEELQALMREHNGVPGFICVDQEGGMVTRLTDPYAMVPGAMACGAGAAEAELRRLGELVGAELMDAGVNMNCAPSFDVNNNPRNPVIGVRSYGDDPERVGSLGTAMFKGLCAAGVLPVGKHFPGHGDTAQDSHLTLPVVAHDRAHVEAVELAPFLAAIRAGIPALMTTHIVFPGLDGSGLPATMSKPILTDYLRGELGFAGLILSDCMQMKAIADQYGTPEGCVAALAAGADLVLVCHDEDVQIASIQAVLRAVRTGALPEAVIDAHVCRVLAAKRQWIRPAHRLSEAELAAHRDFARELSARCVTLVHDARGLLPLRGKRVYALSPTYRGLSIAEDPEGTVNFAKACGRRFGGAWGNFDLEAAADPAQLERVLAGCAAADAVLLGTCNVQQYPAQGELLRQIQALGKPVIQCALRLPYDAFLQPQGDALLCAYDYTPAMVDALLDVLAGERRAAGKLPVRMNSEEASACGSW